MRLFLTFIAVCLIAPAMAMRDVSVEKTVKEDSTLYKKIVALQALKDKYLGNDSLLAITSFELGKVYARMDHISLALQELDESLEYFREQSDSIGVSNSLMAISGAYSSVQEYDKALIYAKRCLGCSLDPKHNRGIFSRLGYLYFNLAEYDSAEKYLNISIELYRQTDVSPARPMVTLGGVNLMRKNYDDALAILLKVDSMGFENISITAQYYVLNFISALYYLKGEMGKKIRYERRRDALRIPPEVKERNLDFFETNFTADTLIGDFEAAVKNQIKYIEALRMIYRDDMVSQLANYQKLYELHDKENAIKILEQENELFRLRENESRFYLIILALGIAIFFISTITFYWSSRMRSGANRKLQELNQHIGLQAADLSKKNELLEEAVRTLKHTQHHLIQSEKMASVGTFVGGMAHELNNPMNVLTGGLQMVEQSLAEIAAETGYENHELVGDTQSLLKQANGSITRVNRIIQALMMAAQSQRAAMMDLAEIIENVELTFRPYWPEDVSLQMNLQSVKVECYPGRIHHAIRAILENAVYYSLQSSISKKHVKLSLKSTEKRAEITICNNGPHIPQKDLMRIFDPFFTTREDDSPGLGLYFAFSAISDHQGVLEVANVHDGVEFTMHLPFSQDFEV